MGVAVRLMFSLCVLALACGPAAAQLRSIEPALAAAIEEALLLTGDYAGAIEGRLRKDAVAALRRFRVREGFRPAGQPGYDELMRLRARAEAAKAALRFEPAIDAEREILLAVARALLPQASRDDGGRRFASADGKAELVTFAQPGGKEALAKLRDDAGGKPLRVAAAVPDDIAVRTEADGTVVMLRAALVGDTVKGIRLRYPASESGRYERAARLMLAAFDPRPRAAGETPAPSFAVLDEAAPPRAAGYNYLLVGGDLTEAPASQDAVSARIVIDRPAAHNAEPKPRLEVTAQGAGSATVEPSDFMDGWKSASVRIVRLDARLPTPAVVYTVFAGSGGCCSQFYILLLNRDGTWRKFEAGPFRFIPRLVDDPARPGSHVLVGEIGAFHDAFGPPAVATAPLTVLRLDGEWLVDVSREDAFRPFHARQLARSLAIAKEDGFLHNSVWPGIVGSARLLGEHAEAVALLAKYHDADAREGREACAIDLSLEACPAEQVKLRPLAVAVEHMLKAAGFGNR